MTTAVRRLTVLRRHIGVPVNPASVVTTGQSPVILATPSLALVDERVTIKVQGLKADQLVTLVANIGEGKRRFESRAVYRANERGEIDTTTDRSLAGTYLGVHPMGFLWSMQTDRHPIQFRKKDVTTPFRVNIRVFDGVHESEDLPGHPLVSTSLERLYKSPGVRRIVVDEGFMKGAVFVPEGTGPFPGILNAYGGLVPLLEERAALLASRGYATFSISYAYPGTPFNTPEKAVNYMKDALEWFSKQDYVDEDRLGLVGLCYGAFLFLFLAANCPKVKSVVNLSGCTFAPSSDVTQIGEVDPAVEPYWFQASGVKLTDEGVLVQGIMKLKNPHPIPVWRHGARVIQISGGDDCQIFADSHQKVEDHWPPQYRANLENFHYPGAGHMIEPPYTPLARRFKLGREAIRNIFFIPNEYADEYLLNGGHPVQHAFAQEDSWSRLLDFLHRTLGITDT